MKVYLISSSSRSSDEMVNVLDSANVSVVAKEMQDDDAALGEVERQIGRGSADILVFITDNHLGAGMELNKMDGVRAAACKDAEEVKAARANNANVIIVNPKAAAQEDIARAIVQAGGMGKLFQTRIAKKGQAAPKPAGAPAAVAQRVQKPKQPVRPDPDVSEQPRRSGGSVFDRIKEELGIVD